MPERISISEFISLTNEDLASQATSTFQSKMSDCRNTVIALEEVSLFTCAQLLLKGVTAPQQMWCVSSSLRFFSGQHKGNWFVRYYQRSLPWLLLYCLYHSNILNMYFTPSARDVRQRFSQCMWLWDCCMVRLLRYTMRSF